MAAILLRCTEGSAAHPTTMIGSKSCIKKRIMLIAKKPKTAIYTLVAVLLIVTFAVGCTFTGAKNGDDTPSDEWFLDEAWPVAEAYAAENGLNIEKSVNSMIRYASCSEVDVVFTETDGVRSVSVTFALGQDGQWAVLPAGGINLLDPERWAGIGIEAAVDGPQAVIDYAIEYTKKELSYYTDDLGYEIAEAKIVGLTQISTGTAGLDSGINLYLLEYRFLAANPDEVMLVGGMQMEDSYITEWGSTGQPYLLLHWDDSGDETVWERICVTNTLIMQEEYSTPEMLKQYGDMYTAAAMELYKKYESGEAFSPADAIDSLFASGDVKLTLNLANDGAYNTYIANEWYSGRFKVLLSDYKWTELEMPLPLIIRLH